MEMNSKTLINRFVIALNKDNIENQKDFSTDNPCIESSSDKLTFVEVAQIMDIARKFPKQKIDKEKLFSCGFSVN